MKPSAQRIEPTKLTSPQKEGFGSYIMNNALTIKICASLLLVLLCVRPMVAQQASDAERIRIIVDTDIDNEMTVYWNTIHNPVINPPPGLITAQSSVVSGAADNEGIAIWGHSMPADITPARLAAALEAVGAANPGRPIVNQSVGGSGTFNSLLRQGAIAWTTEVAGGVIPAMGRVELTNHRSPMLEQQLGAPSAAGLMAGIVWNRMQNTWVEIGGVIGQFGWDNDRASDAPPFFQRCDAGEAVRVKNPVSVRIVALGPAMEHDPDSSAAISTFYGGREWVNPAYPKYYFDYVAASLTGLGSVPPAREWFAKTYPDMFNDPATGWVKTGLFVSVEARNGVAVRLTVREGGRGYTVGDKIIVLAGAIGNTAPITGEVTATREETIGTVRHPDGTVDVTHSYSQWDVDNGYWPRCFRRDFIHFNVAGAVYLSHLLAARIKELE